MEDQKGINRLEQPYKPSRLDQTYRTLQLKTTEYKLFSGAHRVFFSRDYKLVLKEISIYLIGLKLYKIGSLTTIEWNKKSITEVNLGNSQVCGN